MEGTKKDHEVLSTVPYHQLKYSYWVLVELLWIYDGYRVWTLCLTDWILEGARFGPRDQYATRGPIQDPT